MTLLLCPQCQFGILDDDSAPCTACGHLTTDHPDPELEARFGPLTPLPRGRWGPKWKGRDPDDGTGIVLQVIPTTAQHGEEEVVRFDAGIKLARELVHPHLLTPRAAGQSAEFFWYAEAWSDAPSLAECLKQGGLTLAATQQILQQVASGLDYAHRCGVEHGALTPDDVLISPTGWVQVEGVGIAASIAGGPEPWSAEHFEALAPLGTGADQRAVATLIEAALAGPDETPAPLSLRVAEVVARGQAPRPVDRFSDLVALATALDGPEPLSRPMTPHAPPRSASTHPAWAEDLLEPAPVPTRRGTSQRILLGAGVAVMLMAGSLITRGVTPRRQEVGPIPEELSSTQAATLTPPVEHADLPRAAGPPEAPPVVTRAQARRSPTPARPARSVVAPRPSDQTPPPAPALLPVPQEANPPAPAVGYLSVNAHPWGELAIDGRPIGNTPRLALPLWAGTHTLRISRDGYVAVETTITILPGERRVMAGLVLRERTQ